MSAMTDVQRRFEELRSSDSPSPGDLDALWADLTPATVEEVLGAWAGGGGEA